MAFASIGVVLFEGGSILTSWSYGSLIAWTACQHVILALSYNIFAGITRRVHLGHGAFFGIGAYASAVCLSEGVPWVAATIVGGALGFVSASIVGLPLVRLRKEEFAISSLCISLLLGLLARNLEPITGGVGGITVRIVDCHIPYGMSLFLVGFSIWIHNRMLSSSWGRALRATADDPMVAQQVGIDCPGVERKVLILGSTVASLAGAVYPMKTGYLSPESGFGLDMVFSPVIAVLLGGQGTKWGPILGACFTVLVEEFLSVRLPGSSLLFFGLVLVLSGLDVLRQPRNENQR